MNKTIFLCGLSVSAAAMLLSTGVVGAATLPFTRDCDPLPFDRISSSNPVVDPWYITFEQRSADGACVLASIYENNSQNSTVAVGDEIRTLRFNGYGIDFRPTTQGRRPRLASDGLDAGYLTDSGDGRISLTLDRDDSFFNVLSFRYSVGSASGLRLTTTFVSGLFRVEEFPTDLDAQGGLIYPLAIIDFGSESIASLEWTTTGRATVLRLDTLNFSTTAEKPDSGGGSPIPEPSSIALLALAGGLAAFRRRRGDD